MKPTLAIALSLSCLLAISCQKGPTAPRRDASMIGVTGAFPGLAKTAGTAAKNSVGSATALDPSLVTTVVAFCGIDGFMTARVDAGAFSILVDRRQPAALLFIGSAGNSLGYLSLGNGMESIPLNMADSNVTSIDLQTLAATGNVVEPGHNPIGDEIPMTPSDITSYVFSNGSLGSVVRSPDVDADGVADVASGRFYRYTMRYDIRAGTFASALTPVLASPVVINSYVFEVKITDPDLNFPDSISFNGPAGSGIESATSWLRQPFGSDGCSYCAPFITNPSTPPAGTYVVRYKAKTLTFNLLSQTEITKYLAIPVPTVDTSSDGTVQKVTWEYRLSDGSATIDPRALIVNMGIQMDVDLATAAPGVHPYSVYNLLPDVTEVVLTNHPLPWSSVLSVRMGYLDVFGNQIAVIYRKP